MDSDRYFVSVRGHFKGGRWHLAIAYPDGMIGLGFGKKINDALAKAARNAGREFAHAESGE